MPAAGCWASASNGQLKFGFDFLCLLRSQARPAAGLHSFCMPSHSLTLRVVPPSLRPSPRRKYCSCSSVTLLSRLFQGQAVGCCISAKFLVERDLHSFTYIAGVDSSIVAPTLYWCLRGRHRTGIEPSCLACESHGRPSKARKTLSLWVSAEWLHWEFMTLPTFVQNGKSPQFVS